jgi:hypothetical protein
MGAVFVLALLAAIDPVRLGIAALLISRPRPMRNLLAYWLGAMATGITALVGLLILLDHVAPALMPTVSTALVSHTARRIQTGIGLFLIPVAALIGLGFSLRRAQVPIAVGDPAIGMLPPREPRLPARLYGRALAILEDGSEWVAFGFGLVNGPPAEAYPVLLAVIAASGSSVGTRVSASFVFMVGLLTVIEIPLISCLASPMRTQLVMTHLHGWCQTRRRHIFATLLGFTGIMLVASGVGGA